MGLTHCPLTDSNEMLGYFQASDWWLIVVSLLKLPSDECHWTWWRHQMETFSALLAICAGNSPVTDEFPAQRPATRRFDVLFDMHLNNRLSRQWWGWWFEKPSRSIWRHHNEFMDDTLKLMKVMVWCHHAPSHYLPNFELDLCRHIALLGHN